MLPSDSNDPQQYTKVLFAGEVRAVGPEPALWSGRVPSFQYVEYNVLERFNGKWTQVAQFTVYHSVVRGSPIAREDHPGLRPDYFAIGRRLIIEAEERDGKFYCTKLDVWSVELAQRLRSQAGSVP